MRAFKLILTLYVGGCVADEVGAKASELVASQELPKEVAIQQEEQQAPKQDPQSDASFDDDDDDDDGDLETEDSSDSGGILQELFRSNPLFSQLSHLTDKFQLSSLLDPSEAKSAVQELWSDLQEQSREFTRNISPSMKRFSDRMSAAGFPPPLIQGFKEVEVPNTYSPAAFFMPNFLPDIPLMGPLNPATWSQEQINAALNPQVFNIFNPNTVTEIPGLGRFSVAVPPVQVELPHLQAQQAFGNYFQIPTFGQMVQNLMPQTVPSFIKYERIPGEPPSYLNFPELGPLNPANAYEGAAASRQLSIAGDILQNGFDRINDVFARTGGGNGPLANVAANFGAQGGAGGGGGLLNNILNGSASSTSGSGSGLLSSIMDRNARVTQTQQP